MTPAAERSARPGREGFSLLEVMAALAVLSIALVGLLQAQARSVRASHDIQLKSQAVLLAREKMSELELDRPNLELGDDAGVFEDVPPYKWETLIEDRSEFPDLPWLVIRAVTVRIKWPVGQDDRGRPVDKVYEITQFFVQPPLETPGAPA